MAAALAPSILPLLAMEPVVSMTIASSIGRMAFSTWEWECQIDFLDARQAHDRGREDVAGRKVDGLIP